VSVTWSHSGGGRHHFQHGDQGKEWNCWVWEGRGITLNRGCRLVGSSCTQRGGSRYYDCSPESCPARSQFIPSLMADTYRIFVVVQS
jgi:hypothetical protein